MSASAPLVTVCVPAFNAAAHIEGALQSVHEQTLAHWELIVVEDGSDDGVRALVEAFAARHCQPVRYLRHDTNRGLPSARNTAIRAARAPWLAFLDADDHWRARHLESGLAAGSAHALVIADADEQVEPGAVAAPRWRNATQAELDHLPASLFHRCFILPSAVIARRTILEEVGLFDERMRYCEDLDLWFRCMREGHRLHFTRRRSCVYTRRAGAMTGNKLPMALGRAIAYERQAGWGGVPGKVRTLRRAKAWYRSAQAAARTSPILSARCLANALRALAFMPALERDDFFVDWLWRRPR